MLRSHDHAIEFSKIFFNNVYNQKAKPMITNPAELNNTAETHKTVQQHNLE